MMIQSEAKSLRSTIDSVILLPCALCAAVHAASARLPFRALDRSCAKRVPHRPFRQRDLEIMVAMPDRLGQRGFGGFSKSTIGRHRASERLLSRGRTPGLGRDAAHGDAGAPYAIAAF